MNEREIFTSDATVVQVDEQDPQQMQVRKCISACFYTCFTYVHMFYTCPYVLQIENYRKRLTS